MQRYRKASAVLMGLGQGGFLGARFAAATNPRLLSVTPSNGQAGTLFTVSGADLGSSGVLLLNGTPYWGSMQPVWSNDKITFHLPPPIGQPAWTSNTLVAVGAHWAGKDASSMVTIVTI